MISPENRHPQYLSVYAAAGVPLQLHLLHQVMLIHLQPKPELFVSIEWPVSFSEQWYKEQSTNHPDPVQMYFALFAPKRQLS